MDAVWALPLLVLVALLLGAMLAAHEIGLLAHARLRGARGRADGDASDEGFILSGVLGLLALLMAFSFSMAVDRFEKRRDLMLDETSAIGGLAMMAEFVPGEAPAIRAALARYGKARIAAIQNEGGPRQRAAADRAAEMRRPLGAAVLKAIRAGSRDQTALTLALAYDKVEDTAVRRDTLADAHLPYRVLWLLAIYSVVSAGMLGYALAGARTAHRAASTAFYVLLAFAFGVILDLDRPGSGDINVSQTPLEDAIRAVVDDNALGQTT